MRTTHFCRTDSFFTSQVKLRPFFDVLVEHERHPKADVPALLLPIIARNIFRPCELVPVASLVLRSDWKMATVASACGFHGEKYFLRAFKESHGMTPSQWRSSCTSPI